MIVPIDEVVPALPARARMIGDFVSRQSRRPTNFLGQVVERAGKVRVWNSKFAGCVKTLERRIGLDGELIER